MTLYGSVLSSLDQEPKTWLVTGVAGFIGSNVLEALLKINQRVVGLDNFSTGYQRNLDEVQRLVKPEQWSNFQLITGDICDPGDCRRAMVLTGGGSTMQYPVKYVLHQAALGSVPRSIEDPIATNQSNISGFLNMLVAARDARVTRFVYAASSSTYGDHPGLPKVEDHIGQPLSPYAVTKLVNELYADVFARAYDFRSIGLRYFNVFGPRQDPNGAYAAVIPSWTASMIRDEDVFINGDGQTSRDFCYIDNAVQANLLAAMAVGPQQGGGQGRLSTKVEGNAEMMYSDLEPSNKVYNVAVGDRTSLNKLFSAIRSALTKFNINYTKKPVYRDFRPGDVRHSLADITKAKFFLGYQPSHTLEDGIHQAMKWYIDSNKNLF